MSDPSPPSSSVAASEQPFQEQLLATLTTNRPLTINPRPFLHELSERLNSLRTTQTRMRFMERELRDEIFRLETRRSHCEREASQAGRFIAVYERCYQALFHKYVRFQLRTWASTHDSHPPRDHLPPSHTRERLEFLMQVLLSCTDELTNESLSKRQPMTFQLIVDVLTHFVVHEPPDFFLRSDTSPSPDSESSVPLQQRSNRALLTCIFAALTDLLKRLIENLPQTQRFLTCQFSLLVVTLLRRLPVDPSIPVTNNELPLSMLVSLLSLIEAENETSESKKRKEKEIEMLRVAMIRLVLRKRQDLTYGSLVRSSLIETLTDSETWILILKQFGKESIRISDLLLLFRRSTSSSSSSSPHRLEMQELLVELLWDRVGEEGWGEREWDGLVRCVVRWLEFEERMKMKRRDDVEGEGEREEEEEEFELTDGVCERIRLLGIRSLRMLLSHARSHSTVPSSCLRESNHHHHHSKEEEEEQDTRETTLQPFWIWHQSRLRQLVCLFRVLSEGKEQVKQDALIDLSRLLLFSFQNQNQNYYCQSSSSSSSLTYQIQGQLLELFVSLRSVILNLILVRGKRPSQILRSADRIMNRNFLFFITNMNERQEEEEEVELELEEKNDDDKAPLLDVLLALLVKIVVSLDELVSRSQREEMDSPSASQELLQAFLSFLFTYHRTFPASMTYSLLAFLSIIVQIEKKRREWKKRILTRNVIEPESRAEVRRALVMKLPESQIDFFAGHFLRELRSREEHDMHDGANRNVAMQLLLLILDQGEDDAECASVTRILEEQHFDGFLQTFTLQSPYEYDLLRVCIQRLHKNASSSSSSSPSSIRFESRIVERFEDYLETNWEPLIFPMCLLQDDPESCAMTCSFLSLLIDKSWIDPKRSLGEDQWGALLDRVDSIPFLGVLLSVIRKDSTRIRKLPAELVRVMVRLYQTPSTTSGEAILILELFSYLRLSENLAQVLRRARLHRTQERFGGFEDRERVFLADLLTKLDEG